MALTRLGNVFLNRNLSSLRQPLVYIQLYAAFAE